MAVSRATRRSGGRRSVTTVPQQQLFALNSDFMVNQARAFSARVSKLGSTDEERIAAELEKLLDAPRPSVGLRLMEETRLLDAILPELALQRADWQVDLMLTDVGLPTLSGRELADLARGYRPELPVLFMTGYADAALDRQAFLGDGMDMLIKPFRMGELLGKVRQAIGKV